jgi:hypothetical protein
MNLHVITLVIMLIIGIGIPNVLASDIASLNPTGNGDMTLTPTPSPTPTPIPTPIITPNPSISASLNLSEADTNDSIIINETIPTIQQLASNNPNMSSIVINFSTASDMEAEYDEEEQQLRIEITNGEPAEEIGEEETEPEETQEVGEEEEEDDGDDNDNGNNNGNGNDNGNGNGNGNDNDDDNDNDGPGVRVPDLPDIDLNLPGGFFD